MTRRIASEKHNKYVATGTSPHRRTTIAPPSLLKNRPAISSGKLAERIDEFNRWCNRTIGKPYYSREGFVLFNGDCTEALALLAKQEPSIALTLTSPPYNIGKEYESNLAVEDYVRWCAGWMKAIHEITTSDGAFWLNLGYFEVPGRGLCVPIPYLLWDKSDFYLLQEVVWHYGAGVSTKKRLNPRNEKWLFFVRNPDSYVFDLDSIRDPNVKYPNQKKNGKFRCNPLGKNPSDVWEIPKVTTGSNRSSRERTDHPAQFPLRLVERIVMASSRPRDVVLDPFAGSASTGIAAVGLGRCFLGIEIKESYCALAVERAEKFFDERAAQQSQGELI